MPEFNYYLIREKEGPVALAKSLLDPAEFIPAYEERNKATVLFIQRVPRWTTQEQDDE